jgi:hypothetical protein
MKAEEHEHSSTNKIISNKRRQSQALPATTSTTSSSVSLLNSPERFAASGRNSLQNYSSTRDDDVPMQSDSISTNQPRERKQLECDSNKNVASKRMEQGQFSHAANSTASSSATAKSGDLLKRSHALPTSDGDVNMRQTVVHQKPAAAATDGRLPMDTGDGERPLSPLLDERSRGITCS